MPALEDELARARDLTSPDWNGLDLVDSALIPSAADVGALDGFALTLADPPLRANVYVFDGWNAGAAVGERLRELVDGGRYRAVSAINGALLLFAVLEDLGEAGEDALNRLVDRFHGSF